MDCANLQHSSHQAVRRVRDEVLASIEHELFEFAAQLHSEGPSPGSVSWVPLLGLPESLSWALSRVSCWLSWVFLGSLGLSGAVLRSPGVLFWSAQLSTLRFHP